MKSRSCLSPFLAFCALSIYATAEPEPSAAAAGRPLNIGRLLDTGRPVKIVCFGDSITGVYYHTGGRRAWCDLLGIALKRIYPKAQIEMINAGIAGHNTIHALKRMDADVLSHHPQLVVVMFGMNDSYGISPEAYRANLGQIVERARAGEAEVILMTPNTIYPDYPRYPNWRLEKFAEIVRRVGRELDVPVADCFRAYQTIQAVDDRAWVRLMNDTIHPNLRGHKVFAEEVAWTISGRRVSLAELPSLQPGLPKVLARLKGQQPVTIVAMKPYDRLIGPALQSLFPGAEVQVITWDSDRKSLEEIEAPLKLRMDVVERAIVEGRGKDIDSWKFLDHKIFGHPDLVLLAVPADALAPSGEQFHRSYNAILDHCAGVENPSSECLAILPSVAQPELNQAQRTAENLALDVILGRNFPWLQRSPGDGATAADLLTQRLATLLGLEKP